MDVQGRPRFKLHSFVEMGHYAQRPAEWEEECRRNGTDMDECLEDRAVREMSSLRVRQT